MELSQETLSINNWEQESKIFQENFTELMIKLSRKYQELEKISHQLNSREENLRQLEESLNEQQSEIDAFNKVSIMSSMSKQIKDRDRKIKLLEKQVNKYKQKNTEKQKSESKVINIEKNIVDDWNKLSQEIYNPQNTVYDSYSSNDFFPKLPEELKKMGYEIFKDPRNHNNRFWIKKDNLDTKSNTVSPKKDTNEKTNNEDDLSSTINLEESVNTEMKQMENILEVFENFEKIKINFPEEEEEEEEEEVYEEEIEGKNYYVSEGNPKKIYRILKSGDVGKEMGIITTEGNVKWKKKKRKKNKK